MSKKKAPSPEQRKRASYVRAMTAAAETDATHPFWRTIDAAWARATKTETQAGRVRRALDVLVSAQRDANNPKLCRTLDPRGVVRELVDVDPAFARLKSARVRVVLETHDMTRRTELGGNGKPGPWAALARLAHECGALGCDQTAPTPEMLRATRARWRTSRASYAHRT